MRRALPLISAPAALPASGALAALAMVALAALGCQRPRVADPQAAARAYAAAAQRGDGEAIYAMLSERSQRELGPEGTKRLVAEARRELQAQGAALSRPGVVVEAAAVVRFEDGEQAQLELEDGAFYVVSAGVLPSAPRTPAQALGDLRQALSRRSYGALLRVLSVETRGALESDVRALVRGLADPETLDVELRGEDAEVELPGGHVVKLKRESGVWRVEDVR